jgi:hypothetical protein
MTTLLTRLKYWLIGPGITDTMLDDIAQAVREQAAEWGITTT